MSIGRCLVAAAAFALFVPAAPASAHEDGYDGRYSYGNYSDRHERDHARHRRLHRRMDGAHDRAHWEGFYSREEHRAYHRNLRDRHGDFHDDHPGTRHDHYRYRY